MLSVYLGLFTGLGDIVLIPIVLLIGGLLTQIAVAKHIDIDKHIDAKEANTSMIYVAVALGAIVMGSLAIPRLFTPPVPASLVGTLSIGDAVMYTSLYAIAEERFFRGGIFTFLIWQLKTPTLAVLGCTIAFFIYHFAVYGGSTEKLMFVLLGGFTLSYVTWKSGRLAPATLAHTLNNIIATVTGLI